MSKSKTKKARRELKRDGARKIVAHYKKEAKASKAPLLTSKKVKKTHQPTQASQQPTVPFSAYDHVLLVGEGDFSFTSSLTLHHGCANVTATSFDTEEEVRAKYPNFADVEADLKGLTPPVPIHHGIDATKLSSYKHLKCQRGEDDESAREGWDTVAFMFPHTGGLSTDVNRQVRANQGLLVDFFKACLETSTPKQRLLQLAPSARSRAPFLTMGGRVIVTLFEGEPYTLWNVRDLARHAGLKVVESFRFDASQYPGYAHVRTLGAIEGGGAWKGEDRDARMYVFEKVGLVPDSEEEEELKKMASQGKKGRNGAKRKRRESESGDEGE